MEERLLFQKPEDEDDDDEISTASPKKKLLPLIELLTKVDPKSEDKKAKQKPDLPTVLPEAEDKLSKPETESQDQAAEQVSEEEAIIYRSIARDHLAQPVVSGIPEAAVNEFLEKVVDGVEPDSAFESTKMVHQLDGELIDEATITNIEPIETFTTPVSETLEQQVIELPLNNTSSNQSSDNDFLEQVVDTDSRLASPHFSPRSPTNFNLRRSHYTKSAPASQQNTKTLSEIAIKPKIVELENKLIKQEITLQHLSESMPGNVITNPSVLVLERLQPGISESRIDLIKPERAERIGKMLITNERRRSTERLKPTYQIKPEQVKTMRRAELLELSSDLKVEGASLKHMFENNLFDEASLRRLVEAHLKGQNVLELLKREVLDKQNDFERDPDYRQTALKTAALPTDQAAKSFEMEQNLPTKQTNASLPRVVKQPMLEVSQPKPKQTSVSVASALLGVVIVLLIGLILYFVFR